MGMICRCVGVEAERAEEARHRPAVPPLVVKGHPVEVEGGDPSGRTTPSSSQERKIQAAFS